MKTPKSPTTLFSGCLILFAAFAGICVLIVFGLVGHFQWTESSYAATSRRELERIRDRGEPTSDDTLEQWDATRSSIVNRAEWWGLMQYTESKEFKNMVVGIELFDYSAKGTGVDTQGWPAENKYRAFLVNTLEKRLELSRLCKEAKPMHFLDQIDGFKTLLPHVQAQSSLVKICQLEFDVASHDNDVAIMLEAIQKQFALSILHDEEPFFVSRLVCLRSRFGAMQNIRRGIEKRQFNERQLESLERILSSVQPELPRWKDLIVGERAVCLDHFYEKIPESHPPRSQSILPRSNNDLVNYLSFMHRFSNIDLTSMDSALLELSQVESELEVEMTSMPPLKRRHWQGCLSFIPAMKSALKSFCREITQIRITRIAIGIQRFELQQGRFPDSLADLIAYDVNPQELMPMGDKPFGYRKTDRTATLWGPKPELGATTSDIPFVAEETSSDDSNSYDGYLRWDLRR